MTRRAMTPARKKRIWEAHNGLCYHCNKPVPMLGPDVRYDHRIGVWFTERDEDEDVSPAHTDCDRSKTSSDLTKIAKTKRLIAKGVGMPRKESRLKGAGFSKTLKKKFDGSLVRR